jgi:3-hydroxyisobutyrate dehydrogenase-like beta-hydroxyacid dehydrogenase
MVEGTVAVLGLGEAGSEIAADLARAGADVIGWDPAVDSPPAGVRSASSALAAVGEATSILSLCSASAALPVVQEIAPVLEASQLYADLNTTAPQAKRDIAEIVAAGGATFADVALLGPVPGNGIRTPALVSGSGAETFAKRFRPAGMPVEVVGAEPGDAAARKLVNSVFAKGIAAAAIESLAAARAAGCEEWLRGELVRVLEGADAALLERLLTGSRRHAARRVDEMDAACELLAELGVEPRVATAAAGWLRQLDAEAR